MKKNIKETLICNELGLHARPSIKIASIAKKSKSKVWLTIKKDRIDASDIPAVLDIAWLGRKGVKITVEVDDSSDLNILNEIINLIESGFGEE